LSLAHSILYVAFSKEHPSLKPEMLIQEYMWQFGLTIASLVACGYSDPGIVPRGRPDSSSRVSVFAAGWLTPFSSHIIIVRLNCVFC